MAALSTQNIVAAGTAPTFAAAASGGDTAEVGNGGNTFLVVKNANDTNARTVTIAVPGSTSYGESLPDPAIDVEAEEEAWIPLRKEYADPQVAVGRCAITYSDSAADLTVAVVRMG
jgi:hypothetical protein